MQQGTRIPFKKIRHLSIAAEFFLIVDFVNTISVKKYLEEDLMISDVMGMFTQSNGSTVLLSHWQVIVKLTNLSNLST